MRSVWFVLLLAGCDGVFGLGHLNRPPVDAPPGDGTPDSLDAHVCVSMTQHNEDGDSYKDDCDGCPTVTNTVTDTDLDGLPDDCDPNLSRSVDGDQILQASVFASTTELSTFYTQAGGTNAVVASDQLILGSTANATTVMVMTPTQIVAMVTQFATVNGTPQPGDKLLIGANGAVCEVATSGCASQQNEICITLGPNTTHNAPAAEVEKVTVWSDSTGVHCEVATTTHGTFRNDSTGQITSSKGFARVEGNARAALSSLVFYGEK